MCVPLRSAPPRSHALNFGLSRSWLHAPSFVEQFDYINTHNLRPFKGTLFYTGTLALVRAPISIPPHGSTTFAKRKSAQTDAQAQTGRIKGTTSARPLSSDNCLCCAAQRWHAGVVMTTATLFIVNILQAANTNLCVHTKCTMARPALDRPGGSALI